MVEKEIFICKKFFEIFVKKSGVMPLFFVSGFELLRSFNGLRPFHADAVSMGCARFMLTLFQWATPVSGFLWLRRLNGDTV